MVPKKHFFMSHKDKDKGLYNVCFIATNVKALLDHLVESVQVSDL